MEKKDFKELSIEELITYSKQKETPAITIIEGVTDEEFKYVDLISERLFIEPIIVKNSEMIAFVSNSWVIRKIAKDLHKKCQTMYYDFIKRPSGSITIFALTGYTQSWKIIRDNGYQIQAYDEYGEKCDAWINTNIREVEPTYLNSLGLSKFHCTVQIRQKERRGNTEILWHSRNNYVNDGVYNEARNCYYPSGNSNKDIAEYNKLEKLFKKWGFKSM